MQPRTPKLLEDIRDAAAFIADATRDIAEVDYPRNRMLRQSVERNFEIIGEAMRRVAQHDPATAQIIAFRQSLQRRAAYPAGPSDGRSAAGRGGRGARAGYRA